MAAPQTHRIRSYERAAGIELLLTEDVESLGKQGDIVRVRPGYARNFLVPQGLATVATEANKRMVESHRQRQRKVMEAKLATLRKLADDVSKYSVTLEANASPEGHLFGSIVARDISKSLKASSFPIEPGHIKLEGPLKELGMYTVRIELATDVTADVKVWVVPVSSSGKS
ncbi:MAG: 50S ribosomal protein L9 [Planctomycetaceae bacterium]